ncbi:salicylate hydroxylase [Wolfiporia cocos MD-104 SS10]|uniref:Salicylate hydroxylase n=1 Tax=Wolfiporia cocos (strain MD-104) TaxID=742152 RepID=A0A2H3K692_WOLCO|nr:salicylate hydroxylase [Wolfiporia cocos MD-104 SS10]
MSPKFTVAICGGGVGGLTCAVALSRYPDIQVNIYEAASKFAEVGAGIGMWPRAWKVMDALGLSTELSNVAISAPVHEPKVAFTFRQGDQPIGRSFYTLITPGGMTTLHRPEFQSVLLKHVPPSCRMHTSKRLVSYTQPPSDTRRSGHSPAPIVLRFSDGSSATCDLLIGADGVKSNVRAGLVRELASDAAAQGRTREAEELRRAAHPLWSGTRTYRATIPAEVLRARLPGHRVLTEPMIYFGKDTQLTCYPIARGTIINFAAMRARYDLENTILDGPWIDDAPREELLQDFSRWEPEVQALFQSVPRYSRWAIHTTQRLPSFVSGRIALIGDAAHAMMPYQGAGAGQAIEDGYLLATLLGHRKTTLPTLVRALRIYDELRRPFAQRVAETSRENGLLYTLNHPALARGAGLDAAAARIRDNWAWAWETTIDGDVDRALRMLEAS